MSISSQHPNRIARLSPLAFAVAGAISRFALPWVETRIHIIWFWVAAFWAQFFIQSASRERVNASLILLNGAAATFAILCMKFALEGFPGYAGKLLAQLI